MGPLVAAGGDALLLCDVSADDPDGLGRSGGMRAAPPRRFASAAAGDGGAHDPGCYAHMGGDDGSGPIVAQTCRRAFPQCPRSSGRAPQNPCK